jgi:hypothetical protein
MSVSPKTWGPRQWLTAVLCGGIAGAVVVWILAGSDDGSSSRQQAGGRGYEPITPAQESEAKQIAARDHVVEGIAGGSREAVGTLEPWVDESGNELLGAVVRVRLDPPVQIRRARVPVYFFPGPAAPPGTPGLKRFARISATEVTELVTKVLLDEKRVVSIEPRGARASVSEETVLGPDPGPAYRQPEGE